MSYFFDGLLFPFNLKSFPNQEAENFRVLTHLFMTAMFVWIYYGLLTDLLLLDTWVFFSLLLFQAVQQ
jgi:hypothetical protein